MKTYKHPNHYTPGEVRVVDGKEYTLVTIAHKATGTMVSELCTGEEGGIYTGICAGCPHRHTTDCADASFPSRDAICNPPEGSTLRGTTVVVPLSVVPLLALYGALA